MYTKLQKHGLSWGSSTFIGAWHQVLLMHSAIVSTVVFTIYFKFRLLSHLQFGSLSLQGGGGKNIEMINCCLLVLECLIFTLNYK